MINLLIFCLGIISIILYFIFLIHLNKGTEITPFFLTGISFIVFNIIGSLMIALGLSNRPFKYLEIMYGTNLFFHVLATSFVFLLGASLFRPFKSKEKFFERQNSHSFREVYKFFHLIVGIISILVLYIYIRTLTEIPLFYAFSDDSDFISNALERSKATAGYSGDYWKYNLSMSYFLPLISWFFLVRLALYRTISDKILFLLFFCISIFASIITLQKAPLLIYITFTYLMWFQIRGKKINIRKLLKLAFVIIALLIVTYTFFMNVRNQGIIAALTLALNRLFIGQIYSGLMYLDVFPHKISYLMGKTLPNPGGILPHTPVNAAFEIWKIYNPDLYSYGIRGTLNTTYIMEGYSNFGYPGMYIISFITGSIIIFVSNYLKSFKLREFAIPMSYLLSSQFIKLSMTDFSYVFLGLNIYIVIFVEVALIVLSQIVSKGITKKIIKNE